MIVDYHMHLRDEATKIDHTAYAAEKFAIRATERGVDEIGFTEHVYYFAQTRSLWSLPSQRERCRFDLDTYVDAVVDAKRRGLPVKLGLEVDWTGERAGELDEILRPYPWDYLLCSVHWIDGGHAVDSEPNKGAWMEWEQDEVWRRYVHELSQAARSGRFDVLSHPDLAKIFGVRGSDELYGELAAAVDDSGVALEISTAGLRKPVGELYPDARLLRLSRAPVTLASDAHEPVFVGEDFDDAVAFAHANGRDTVSVFEGRVRRQEPLG
ncbi:MAG TPA: PHP domain-containing protein [Gaiellaceae bacterium]|nr:PHP domain-containing protein [Gaiellaceae bacterium]